MSNRRTMLDFPRNEAGLVDEFLGTAWDVVYSIYKNLDAILQTEGNAALAEASAEAARASELAAKLSEENASASQIAAAEAAAQAAQSVIDAIAARDMAEASAINALGYLELVQAATIEVNGNRAIVEQLAAETAEYAAAVGPIRADFADQVDPNKGASLVGHDGITVAGHINDSRKLANYAALRAYKGTAKFIRVTQVGISGWFESRAFVPGDVDNGGTRIVSNDGTRTYNRDWNFMEAELSWFGVKTGSFDNTAAMQLAMDSGIKGLRASVGITKWTDTVQYKAGGQYIIGGGQSASILMAETGTKDGLVVRGLSGCKLIDVKLTGSGNTGGSLLLVEDSQLFRGHGVRVEKGFNGVDFNRVNNCKLSMGVIADLTGNFGVRFKGDSSFKSDVVNLVDMEISHFSNLNIDAVLWESYAHSLTMTNVRIIRGGRALHAWDSSGAGTAASRPSFLQMLGCEFDFPNYEGMLLECMRDAWLVNIYAHGSLTGDNIVIGADTLTTMMANVRSNSAAKNGLVIDGDGVTLCSSKFLSNGNPSPNTYDGIRVGAAANGVSIVGCQSGIGGTASQRYGLYIETGASNVNFTGNNFTGNVTGNVRQIVDNTYEAGDTFRHVFRNGGGIHGAIGGATANVINYLRMAGGAAGQSAKLVATGGDSNIHVELTPLGTGTLLITGISQHNYANDAAAQAAGIPLNGMYHTDGAIKFRRT